MHHFFTPIHMFLIHAKRTLVSRVSLVVENLRAALSKLECRVAVLEKSPAAVSPASAPAPSVPYTNVSFWTFNQLSLFRIQRCFHSFNFSYDVQGTAVQQKTSTPAKEEEEEDDDDIDLFGSDEDEEAEKLKEQRLKEYAEKKAKKPAIIAKSSILLDVKPVSLCSIWGQQVVGQLFKKKKKKAHCLCFFCFF